MTTEYIYVRACKLRVGDLIQIDVHPQLLEIIAISQLSESVMTIELGETDDLGAFVTEFAAFNEDYIPVHYPVV